MTGAEKKMWSTPRLRVFVRTKTEEAVLWFCKNSSGARTGPLYRNSTCYFNTSCSSRCEGAVGS